MSDGERGGGFHLYPAIDLRFGRCVRLEKGRADRATDYGGDPLRVAASFCEAGARWIHVVDLDAAFGDGSNREVIAGIATAVPARVQTGGGVRGDADLEALFAAGVARAVIGTAAVEDPEFVRRAVARWGAGRIAVGLDARGRRPAVRGWTEEAAGADLFELARSVVALGVRTLIHTDIERDGMMEGPNLALSAELAAASGAEVIVSGGVREVDDVQAAAERAGEGIVGVIAGRAVYEGRLPVADGVRAAGG